MNKYFQAIRNKFQTYDLKAISKILIIPTVALNLVLAGFLFFEYSDLRKKSERLELFQSDYQEYQRILKHIIEDYCEHQSALSQAKVQEKEQEAQPSAGLALSSATAEFIPLNRDPKHLQETVLASVLKEAEKKISLKQRLKKRQRHLVMRPAPLPEEAVPSYPLVKHAPFVWPLDKNNFWISSHFGKRRMRRTGKVRFHAGVDMAAERGTLVKSAADGKVEYAGSAGTFGAMILIAHDARYKTRYAHLSKVLVKEGEPVKQGQIIGCVGNTGRVSGKNGNHLHFEVLSFGRAVNPMKFLG